MRFVKRFFIPFDFLSAIIYNFIGLIYYNEKCGETMYKVGICGYFGLGKEFVSGQTDKTKAVYNAIAKVIGEENIAVLDSCGWQKNPLKLVYGCRKLLAECENVIMMPARKGFKVFPRVFEFLNKSFGRKLHYVVVGGWLPDRLENNPTLIPSIKKLDCVYVELEQMRDKLHSLGITNAVYMPNFRKTNALRSDELIYSTCEPYRLCTFSRILREKGIEEAMEAVRFVNNTLGRTVYTLDIYGTVEPVYQNRFNELAESFEPYISYKGFVDTNDSTSELKSCFALLFPTFCEGEGFAGTIIDAFAAGVPVIATDWHYNSSIIRHLVDGIIYDSSKPELLGKILLELHEKPDSVNSMKVNCLERVCYFEPDEASMPLLRELGILEESEKSNV